MNDDIMQTYSFTYTDLDGKKYEKSIATPGCTWMECLNDYIRFLESVFQYNIMDSVRLKEPVYLAALYDHFSDHIDPWTGKYFVEEEQDNEDIGNPGLTD